jgi:hypothetical protein
MKNASFMFNQLECLRKDGRDRKKEEEEKEVNGEGERV